jgi:hypothetical protein
LSFIFSFLNLIYVRHLCLPGWTIHPQAHNMVLSCLDYLESLDFGVFLGTNGTMTINRKSFLFPTSILTILIFFYKRLFFKNLNCPFLLFNYFYLSFYRTSKKLKFKRVVHLALKFEIFCVLFFLVTKRKKKKETTKAKFN